MSAMFALRPFLHWFAQHPLGTATIVYATCVFGVLLYAYLEPRHQT